MQTKKRPQKAILVQNICLNMFVFVDSVVFILFSEFVMSSKFADKHYDSRYDKLRKQ